MPTALLAVGADGAPGGWLAALAFGDRTTGHVDRIELQLPSTFAELAALRTDGAPFAVDVPMGLPDVVEPRACDVAARKALGARKSSVFTPPSRPLLAAATYTDARDLVELARRTDPGAKGLSAQAFGIVPKVREADEFLRAHPDARDWLFECHPELSFQQLAGDEQALAPKKSVAGGARRVALVVERFPRALDIMAGFGAPGRAELVDALDALVCLHTALRVRTGDHVTLGDGRRDAHGLPMRMVV
ncbi:MAG TPA: DUF429 domain-containing protein [Solirubrobacteraceae bacterium]|jgi:predicted RNase H-like nuclease